MNRKEQTEKLTAKALVVMILFFMVMLFSYSVNAQVIDNNNKKLDKVVKKYKFKKFVKGIFQYSTLYTSFTETSPLFTPAQYFVTQGGEVQNITPEVSNDYVVSWGIRKVARFDYENRANRFYDGTEQTTSLNSNYSSIRGLEYYVNYSKGRQQGRDFKSERYFLRYSAKWWSSRIDLQKNGLINLDYKSLDIRFRLPIGKKLSISFGPAVRTHLPYGYSPIENFLLTRPWWELAYDYGYMDHFYQIDYDNDGEIDNFDWWWSDPNGDRVNDTDAEFRKSTYARIVRDYNKNELESIGTLGTLSGVVGADFYHYRDKFWLHAWGNVYPIHKHIHGDEAYSYENYIGSNDWIDHNVGFMFGWFLDKNKKFGIYTEYEQTKFWDKNLSYTKVGLNWKL